MPTILHLYSVSVSAMQVSENLMDTTKNVVLWEHQPFLLEGIDMSMAVDRAKIIAFDHWKVEEGWSQHSATIVALTQENLSGVLSLLNGNEAIIVRGSVEGYQHFKLDGTPRTDLEFGSASDNN